MSVKWEKPGSMEGDGEHADIGPLAMHVGRYRGRWWYHSLFRSEDEPPHCESREEAKRKCVEVSRDELKDALKQLEDTV